MPPDHQTSERVYGALKRDLLEGILGSGRLNITSLESRYSTSATPVREALLRLVGEKLVDMRPTGGFAPWVVGPTEARDLYELNQKLIMMSLGLQHGSNLDAEWTRDGCWLDPPVDGLFLSIAQQGRNAVLVASIESLNDRLCRLRMAEQKVLGGLGREFGLLAGTVREGQHDAIRRAVTGYHRRRLRNLDSILRAL